MESHIPRNCLPQGDLPAVHSRYTQKQCTSRGPLGSLPSLSLTTKGSWKHLRRGLLSLSSAFWRQYPMINFGSRRRTPYVHTVWHGTVLNAARYTIVGGAKVSFYRVERPAPGTRDHTVWDCVLVVEDTSSNRLLFYSFHFVLMPLTCFLVALRVFSNAYMNTCTPSCSRLQGMVLRTD